MFDAADLVPLPEGLTRAGSGIPRALSGRRGHSRRPSAAGTVAFEPEDGSSERAKGRTNPHVQDDAVRSEVARADYSNCHVLEACTVGEDGVALAMSDGRLCHADLFRDVAPTPAREQKPRPPWRSWLSTHGSVKQLAYSPAGRALVTLEHATTAAGDQVFLGRYQQNSAPQERCETSSDGRGSARGVCHWTGSSIPLATSRAIMAVCPHRGWAAVCTGSVVNLWAVPSPEDGPANGLSDVASPPKQARVTFEHALEIDLVDLVGAEGSRNGGAKHIALCGHTLGVATDHAVFLLYLAFDVKGEPSPRCETRARAPKETPEPTSSTSAESPHASDASPRGKGTGSGGSDVGSSPAARGQSKAAAAAAAAKGASSSACAVPRGRSSAGGKGVLRSNRGGGPASMVTRKDNEDERAISRRGGGGGGGVVEGTVVEADDMVVCVLQQQATEDGPRGADSSTRQSSPPAPSRPPPAPPMLRSFDDDWEAFRSWGARAAESSEHLDSYPIVADASVTSVPMSGNPAVIASVDACKVVLARRLGPGEVMRQLLMRPVSPREDDDHGYQPTPSSAGWESDALRPALSPVRVVVFTSLSATVCLVCGDQASAPSAATAASATPSHPAPGGMPSSPATLPLSSSPGAYAPPSPASRSAGMGDSRGPGRHRSDSSGRRASRGRGGTGSGVTSGTSGGVWGFHRRGVYLRLSYRFCHPLVRAAVSSSFLFALTVEGLEVWTFPADPPATFSNAEQACSSGDELGDTTVVFPRASPPRPCRLHVQQLEIDGILPRSPARCMLAIEGDRAGVFLVPAIPHDQDVSLALLAWSCQRRLRSVGAADEVGERVADARSLRRPKAANPFAPAPVPEMANTDGEIDAVSADDWAHKLGAWRGAFCGLRVNGAAYPSGTRHLSPPSPPPLALFLRLRTPTEAFRLLSEGERRAPRPLAAATLAALAAAAEGLHGALAAEASKAWRSALRVRHSVRRGSADLGMPSRTGAIGEAAIPSARAVRIETILCGLAGCWKLQQAAARCAFLLGRLLLEEAVAGAVTAAAEAGAVTGARGQMEDEEEEEVEEEEEDGDEGDEDYDDENVFEAERAPHNTAVARACARACRWLLASQQPVPVCYAALQDAAAAIVHRGRPTGAVGGQGTPSDGTGSSSSSALGTEVNRREGSISVPRKDASGHGKEDQQQPLTPEVDGFSLSCAEAFSRAIFESYLLPALGVSTTLHESPRDDVHPDAGSLVPEDVLLALVEHLHERDMHCFSRTSCYRRGQRRRRRRHSRRRSYRDRWELSLLAEAVVRADRAPWGDCPTARFRALEALDEQEEAAAAAAATSAVSSDGSASGKRSTRSGSSGASGISSSSSSSGGGNGKTPPSPTRPTGLTPTPPRGAVQERPGEGGRSKPRRRSRGGSLEDPAADASAAAAAAGAASLDDSEDAGAPVTPSEWRAVARVVLVGYSSGGTDGAGAADATSSLSLDTSSDASTTWQGLSRACSGVVQLACERHPTLVINEAGRVGPLAAASLAAGRLRPLIDALVHLTYPGGSGVEARLGPHRAQDLLQLTGRCFSPRIDLLYALRVFGFPGRQIAARLDSLRRSSLDGARVDGGGSGGGGGVRSPEDFQLGTLDSQDGGVPANQQPRHDGARGPVITGGGGSAVDDAMLRSAAREFLSHRFALSLATGDRGTRDVEKLAHVAGAPPAWQAAASCARALDRAVLRYLIGAHLDDLRALEHPPSGQPRDATLPRKVAAGGRDGNGYKKPSGASSTRQSDRGHKSSESSWAEVVLPLLAGQDSAARAGAAAAHLGAITALVREVAWRGGGGRGMSPEEAAEVVTEACRRLPASEHVANEDGLGLTPSSSSGDLVVVAWGSGGQGIPGTRAPWPWGPRAVPPSAVGAIIALAAALPAAGKLLAGVDVMLQVAEEMVAAAKAEAAAAAGSVAKKGKAASSGGNSSGNGSRRKVWRSAALGEHTRLTSSDGLSEGGSVGALAASRSSILEVSQAAENALLLYISEYCGEDSDAWSLVAEHVRHAGGCGSSDEARDWLPPMATADDLGSSGGGGAGGWARRERLVEALLRRCGEELGALALVRALPEDMDLSSCLDEIERTLLRE